MKITSFLIENEPGEDEGVIKMMKAVKRMCAER